MCEVAVCEGDDGWHERTSSRVSRCECNGKVSERRDTQVCVGRMETTTASDKRQGPSSGRSYFEHRTGFTQRRAGGPGRATHETSTCSAARVRPGPGTPAVDVADPTDGQRPGWVDGFGTDGFSTPAGVRNSTWPARCVLFAECTAQVTDEQEHMCSRGEPLGLRGLFLRCAG